MAWFIFKEVRVTTLLIKIQAPFLKLCSKRIMQKGSEPFHKMFSIVAHELVADCDKTASHLILIKESGVFVMAEACFLPQLTQFTISKSLNSM